MSDKKIFYNTRQKYIKFKPKSKHFANAEIEERKHILKKMLDKKSRKLNQKEKIEIVNQLSRKENLTFNILNLIIDLKERNKIENINIKNLNRELADIEEKRKEINEILDNKYKIIEVNTERLNRFIMRYS